jgi:hypothetical protein
MSLPPASIAALQRLLEALKERAGSLGALVHEQWIDQVCTGLHPSLASSLRTPAHAATLSELLGRRFNVTWPGLDSLAQRAHRVVLLPAPCLQQCLRLAAVWFHAPAVRRCVSRQDRALLRDLLGEAGYAGVLAAPDSAPMRSEQALPNLEAAQWASQGVVRLRCLSAWSCEPALSILRLALPRKTNDLPLIGDVGATARQHMQHFLQRLDQLLPEHAWLFGSDLDLALSTPKTV